MLDERLVQDRDIDLAIAEDDGVADVLGSDQLAQDLAFGPILPAVAEAETLGDRIGRCGWRGDLDPLRIREKLIDEAGDLRRHCGGEKQRLAARRQQFADLLDVGNEAHVEHAVRLVDDEDLHAHEHQFAALEVIEKASRSGDEHIDAAVELAILIIERDATDQERQV